MKSPGHFQIPGLSCTFQDCPYSELIHIKVEVHSSSEPTLKYNQGQVTSEKPRSIMIFLTKSRVTGILCSAVLILEEKAGKQIPEIIKTTIVRKDFRKHLGLLRCRRQHLHTRKQGKYCRFIFVENTVSNSASYEQFHKFIGMSRFGGSKNAFAMVTDLSERHFDTNFFPFDKNERNDLYGLWQQHKQLKTMEFNKN